MYKWAVALQEISKRKLGTARVQAIKQAISKYLGQMLHVSVREFNFSSFLYNTEALSTPGLNTKRKADAEEQSVELKRLLGTLIGDSLTSLGVVSFEYSTGGNNSSSLTI